MTSKIDVGRFTCVTLAVVFSSFLTPSISLAQDGETSVYQLVPVEERLTIENTIFFSLTDEPDTDENQQDESKTSDADKSDPPKANVTIISLPPKRETPPRNQADTSTTSVPNKLQADSQSAIPATKPAAEVRLTSSEKIEAMPSKPEKATTDAAPPKPKNGSISAALIEERRKQTEGVELTPEQRTKIDAHFQKAQELLKLAEEFRQKVATLKGKIEKSPQLIDELKAQFKQPLKDVDLTQISDQAQLAQQLATVKQELTQVEDKLKAFESHSKERTDRKTALASMLEDLKKRLNETQTSIANPPASGEAPSIVLARRTELEALTQLLKHQIELVPVEQSYYTTFADGFVLQRDLAARNKKQLQEELEALEKLQANLRQEEIRQQALAAKKAVQEAHPALKELALRNAELTQKRSEITQSLKQFETDVETIKSLLESIQTKIENARDKEERTGLTTSIGLLLRNEKYHLPDVIDYKARQKSAEQDILRLHEELIALEDERESLGDLEEKAKDIENTVHKSGTPVPADLDLNAMSLELLNARRQYLTDLIHDYESRLETQVELSTLEKSLIAEVNTFREYIDQRILWIRSANMAGVATLQATSTGLADLFSLSRWQDVLSRLFTTASENPLTSAAFGFLMLTLIVLQGFFIRRISQLGKVESEESAPEFTATMWAFAMTGLVAMVWPALIWITGHQMRNGSSVDEFSYVMGQALQFTAILFLSFELLRQLCRPQGVAECHLDWPQDAVRSLHRKLIGLMIVGLPLVFCFRLAGNWQDGQWADSVGRLSFISAMVWFGWSLHRMLHPGGTILQAFAKQVRTENKSWVATAAYLLAIVSPLTLAALAFIGYQYTAEQLFIRLELTLWLAVALLVVSSLFLRSVSNAQSGIARLRDRLQTVVGRETHSEEAHELSAEEDAESEFENREAFIKQARKFSRVAAIVLFLAGNWTIWGEVLPALDRVSGIELWWTTVQVAEAVTGETGTQIVPTSKSVPITLGHLIFSVCLLVMTSIAAGNVPMFLELTLLKRMPMEAGLRNAVTTLFRYAIAVVGMIFAAKTIGIGWSNVQWLVAALTVGLGFGLQEIFANFVSGLIILFERPVRIGDVVTIDGVSGAVSKIQIRATTIRDFDKKEYLVPNKEFVTGRLMNWTLSDKMNRVVINVGISYGADPDKARALMLQVADDNPRVLKDPAPVAGFEGFGDSSLNLVLRCFLPDLDNRLGVISDLHTEINKAFNQHNIEIPFPQMDLHVIPDVSNSAGEDESHGGLSKAA